MQRVLGPPAHPAPPRTRHAGADEHRPPDEQRTYGDADERKILDLIERQPDATLKGVAEALGKPAHQSTVSRTLTRLGLPRKKSPRTPASGTGPT